MSIEIERAADQIADLEERREGLIANRLREGRFRALLYENGKPLENAVVESLRILGFTAEHFQDSRSEFDVVFSSDEGRFIGEVEGKETKAVNIDKISQLNRNVSEDFVRDGVDTPAKGVLFGNAYRLKEPLAREEFFTTKAIDGARQWKFALVRTTDLFHVVRYLCDYEDTAYARACRKAIADTEGAVVVFPPPLGGIAS